MNREAISVSQLNMFIKGILEDNSLLSNILIKGEISNFKYHSSGHMYFTLKDEDSKIKAVMFKGYNSFLKFMPEDGMKVIIEGYVSVYERDGQYQLYCTRMQPEGIGDLYLAYEQLKKKLETEGLFDEQWKKPIPLFPKRLGVVTSQTGAVIKDIINVATRRFRNIDILLYPAKVQGIGAAESIIEGIEYLNTRNDIDVIIIGRGGGSIEELWAFNEENVARAIFNSKIPVISAVGHETDYTISDFVADIRASTPSHAAEIAVPVYSDLKFKISKLSSELFLNSKGKISEYRYNVNDLIAKVKKYSPENKIKQHLQYVDNLQNKLVFLMDSKISDKKSKYSILLNRMDALSPIKVLSRGYSYAEKDGKVLNEIKDVKIEDNIRLHMQDGVLECKVLDKMEVDLWQLRKKS